MKNLSPSGIGIVVDKSKATKTFPITKTVPFALHFKKQTVQEEPGESIGKLTAIVLFLIYITLGFVIFGKMSRFPALFFILFFYFSF